MYDTLLKLPLFQGLFQEDFNQILEKMKLHFLKYRAGEVIVQRGARCDRLIFLLKGELTTQTTSEEGTFTLIEHTDAPCVIEPHALLGMSVQYTSSYVARTEVNAISINKEFVIGTLLTYDIFRLNYMNLLSNRSQNLHARLWREPSLDLFDKIVSFVWMHCERPQGEKVINVTMESLANHLGDTRLNVSKKLNELQTWGLVVLHRKKIVVKDANRLMEWNETRKQQLKATV